MIMQPLRSRWMIPVFIATSESHHERARLTAISNSTANRRRKMTSMTTNRSVPTDTLLPHIMYQNVAKAIEWLTSVFGFTEHYRYGDPVSGAQLYAGKACIMVNNKPEQ